MDQAFCFADPIEIHDGLWLLFIFPVFCFLTLFWSASVVLSSQFRPVFRLLNRQLAFETGCGIGWNLVQKSETLQAGKLEKSRSCSKDLNPFACFYSAEQ